MITFEDYLQLAIKECNSRPGRRMGQNYFNLLFQYKPGICENILSDYPMFDPFYEDENIPRFLWHVVRCWDEQWANYTKGVKDERYLANRTNQGHSRRWLDG